MTEPALELTGELESHLLGGLLEPSSPARSSPHQREVEPGWPAQEEKVNNPVSYNEEPCYTLPQQENCDLVKERDVLVVAVIGSTNSIGGGHNVTNNLFHHIPFQGTPPLDPFHKWRKSNHVKGEETLLQITESPDSGVIYLQLSDIGDMSILGRVMDRLETLNNGQGAGKHEFHHWLTSVECIHVKSLLFVFLCAHHILILGQRPGRLDITWFKLFPLLKKAKVALQEPITQILMNKLKDFTDRSALMQTAMPANFVPVIAFGLPRPPTREIGGQLAGRDRRRGRGVPKLPAHVDPTANIMERQRIRMGKQIMAMLRICCADSYTEYPGEDRLGCQTLLSVVHGRVVFWLPDGASKAQEFMYHHVENLFNKEFPHVKQFERCMKAARVDVKKTAELVRKALTNNRNLPRREDWVHAAMLVYDALTLRPELREKAGKKHPLYLDTSVIETHKLDTIGAYSARTCERFMSGCHKIYQDRLPQVYTEKLHNERLKLASDYLKSNSVGPCQQVYLESLEKTLKAFWEDGRQACNAVSLTGRPCIYRLHALPGRGNGAAEGKYHSTGFNNKHVCACGKTQYQRNDPFDLDEANHNFYMRDCCRQHVIYDIAGTGTSTGFGVVRLCEGSEYRPTNGLTPTLQKGFKSSKKQLLPWDLPIDRTIQNSVNGFIQVAQQVKRAKNNASYASKIAEHSHSTKANPPDALLGKWLQQSRTFLKNDIARQYAKLSPSKSGSRRQVNQQQKQVGPPDDDIRNCEYLRCYVGLEFECFRGHRFILGYRHLLHLAGMNSCPTGHNGGVPRGVKICWREFPPCDVPLALQCSCGESKSGSSVVSQLQRLVIRTPPAPLSICANPKIQCHRPEERFELPTRGGVILPPDSLVLFRLPYILYNPESKRGVPPDKCRLLKGALQVNGAYSKVNPSSAAGGSEKATIYNSAKIQNKLMRKRNNATSANTSSAYGRARGVQ